VIIRVLRLGWNFYYQDVFSSPLALTVFATYIPPSWILEPQALLRIAMAVYPH
jgi:enhancer of polycomb-like protein